MYINADPSLKERGGCGHSAPLCLPIRVSRHGLSSQHVTAVLLSVPVGHATAAKTDITHLLPHML